MDLTERLRDYLQTQTNLPVYIGFLIPDEELGLVEAAGSSVIAEDYSGNQTWRVNYAITLRSDDPEAANAQLYAINKALNGLDDLESNEKAFTFIKLTITSAPNLQQQGTDGLSVYGLDFYVEIDKKRKGDN